MRVVDNVPSMIAPWLTPSTREVFTKVGKKTKQNSPPSLSHHLDLCLYRRVFLGLRSVSLMHDPLQMNNFACSQALDSRCLLHIFASPYVRPKRSKGKVQRHLSGLRPFFRKNNFKSTNKTTGKRAYSTW